MNNQQKFIEAIISNNVEYVKLLMNDGEVKINLEDEYRWTPLHRAAVNDRTGIINILVNHGANVHSRGNCGWTPLHLAVVSQNYFGIEELIKLGSDVNAVANNGDTPLHLTLFDDREVDVVKLLIANGADLSAKNKNNQTPLDIAKLKGAKGIQNIIGESSGVE